MDDRSEATEAFRARGRRLRPSQPLPSAYEERLKRVTCASSWARRTTAPRWTRRSSSRRRPFHAPAPPVELAGIARPTTTRRRRTRVPPRAARDGGRRERRRDASRRTREVASSLHSPYAATRTASAGARRGRHVRRARRGDARRVASVRRIRTTPSSSTPGNPDPATAPRRRLLAHRRRRPSRVSNAANRPVQVAVAHPIGGARAHERARLADISAAVRRSRRSIRRGDAVRDAARFSRAGDDGDEIADTTAEETRRASVATPSPNFALQTGASPTTRFEPTTVARSDAEDPATTFLLTPRARGPKSDRRAEFQTRRRATRRARARAATCTRRRRVSHRAWNAPRASPGDARSGATHLDGVVVAGASAEHDDGAIGDFLAAVVRRRDRGGFRRRSPSRPRGRGWTSGGRREPSPRGSRTRAGGRGRTSGSRGRTSGGRWSPRRWSPRSSPRRRLRAPRRSYRRGYESSSRARCASLASILPSGPKTRVSRPGASAGRERRRRPATVRVPATGPTDPNRHVVPPRGGYPRPDNDTSGFPRGGYRGGCRAVRRGGRGHAATARRRPGTRAPRSRAQRRRSPRLDARRIVVDPNRRDELWRSHAASADETTTADVIARVALASSSPAKTHAARIREGSRPKISGVAARRGPSRDTSSNTLGARSCTPPRRSRRLPFLCPVVVAIRLP